MVAVNSGPKLLHTGDLPTMLHQPRESAVVGDARDVASAVGRTPVLNPNTFTSPIIPFRRWRSERLSKRFATQKATGRRRPSLLGIGRTTLYRKLKEYGVEVADLQ